MLKDVKIGFIGPGKMAGAIINGLILGNELPHSQIYVYGRNPDRGAYFASLGCTVCSSIDELNKDADIIILSVKPQNFPDIYPYLQPVVTKDKVYVSIAAGIDFQNLKDNLGSDLKFVRAMPNTPLLLCQGATALCRTDNVSDEEYEVIRSVFRSSGAVADIEEEQMNAVIAVSGSSPAYIYLFAKTVCDYADSIGLDHKKALELFSQTLIGSAEMLRSTDYDETQLIDMVCSKGGTTIEAVNTLRSTGFCESVTDAMKACIRRAEELSGK